MAISIDRVYQTVQRIINVEQRGQLPPTDFNFFAGLVQLELFNNMFYDLAHFMISPKGVRSDLQLQLQEKIDVFITRDTITSDGRFTLPDDLYRLETLYFMPDRGNRVIIEHINHTESNYIMNSKLTAPSTLFPKYERFLSVNKGIGEVMVYPASIKSILAEYIMHPSDPVWGYRTLVGAAVYDNTISNDFDLHPSMEDDLIMKILSKSGVSIKQEELAVYSANQMSSDQQIEKN